MRKFSKREIILLNIILILGFLISINANSSSYHTNEYEKFEKFKTRNAGIYTPIFIDGAATGVGAHNWTWAEGQVWCSGSGTFTDPYILKDLVIDGNNATSGIFIQNSNKFVRIENCSVYNSSSGTFPDYDAGIELLNVNNTILLNNILSNNQGSGMALGNINNCSVVENIANANLGNGIHLTGSNNNNILRNTLYSNFYGLYLTNGINNTISYNIAYNNWAGIGVLNSFFNNVSLNSAYNNTFMGIYVYESNSITVSGNTVNYNDVRGIELGSCNNSAIYNNTAKFNHQEGISITFCYFNNITGNKLFRNDRWGIVLSTSKHNMLKENILEGHAKGIETLYISNNIFFRNKFIENSYGLYLALNSASNNNTAFNNEFIDNSVNAFDNGTDNKWDNGSIGNFWYDYPDKDVNDNGIGDNVYNISGGAGSQDNYPLWWDPPLISIYLPEDNVTFEDNPYYNISIIEGIVDAMWYSLDGGVTITTIVNLTGFIDPSIWNNEVDGQISIAFYANDSRGYIGFDEITVIKDSGSIVDLEIPGYDIFLLFGVISVVFIFLMKKHKLKIREF